MNESNDISDEQSEGTVLSDTEKKRVLDDVKESMSSLTLANDKKLAEQLKRVVASVDNLGQSSSTIGDLNFTVNVLDYAVDCATTHLENSGPTRELFQENCIADGETMLSWCPGGYDQLVQMTQTAVSFRPSFHKYITQQDLEEQHSTSDLNAPTGEKKARRQRAALVRGPATAPRKITTIEGTQAQKVNMQSAYEVLRQRARQGPIPFYRFVINPKSFVQTAYNMFIVSFLVHERYAYLSIGEGHELLIGPNISNEGSNDRDEFSVETIQLVQSLSALEWDQLVTKLKITESMLPDFCPKESQYFQVNQLAHELATGVVFLNP